MIKNNKWFIVLILLISACSTQTGRYQQKHDSTPTRLPTSAELVDPIPRSEPHSRGGNKNYSVRGKSYNVLDSAKNFKQTGIASWYGNKFHGHLTSNGEIYNMYSMSAAHKNLPLPTYVKVTNHLNKKTVVVRVNDRGPFHENRVIDLSYSAAYKLDMLKKGTAIVTIEAINTDTAINKTLSPIGYIQVFATQHQNIAIDTSNKLKEQYAYQITTPYQDGIYRVKIGPFTNQIKLEQALTQIKNSGYPKAFKSYIK
jgi:rare lipoprotein A